MSNKLWLEHFVQYYESSGSNFKWRGVARIASIDEEKINTICNYNCKEIAVGVEMIKKGSNQTLKSDANQLITAIDLRGYRDKSTGPKI